jgi:hypothetical protein
MACLHHIARFGSSADRLRTDTIPILNLRRA